MILLLVALAGGLGAAARFVVDGAVNARRPTDFPWGSLVVNLIGSFVLGLLAGRWLDLVLAESAWSWRLVLGTGLAGGFTTFSTAMLESARLVAERRWVTGIVLALVMAVLCVAAATAGFALG